jgi:hypothetical protein
MSVSYFTSQWEREPEKAKEPLKNKREFLGPEARDPLLNDR